MPFVTSQRALFSERCFAAHFLESWGIERKKNNKEWTFPLYGLAGKFSIIWDLQHSKFRDVTITVSVLCVTT